MRQISVDRVESGMVLARAIYNPRGDVLLNAGIALTDRYIQYLKDKGFFFVLISDKDADDIELVDIVSERVRMTATKSLFRVYDALERHVGTMRDVPVNRLRAAIRSEEVAKATEDTAGYERLVGDIEHVVDEVLEAPVMTGLNSLRSHDNYLFFHALDVAITAVMIGKRLYFDRRSLVQLAQGCILMDIGNTFIDKAILQKPGPLTPAEAEKIKQHPVLGYELLRTMRGTDPVSNHIAYQHHERQDGTGYPRGLHSTNRVFRERYERHERGRILLHAEIAGIADVYDALGSERPFRSALAPDLVVRALRELAGSHLNREIVQEFLAILPVYPVGTDVLVTTGEHTGFRGVVARVHFQKMDRPTIRLLTNANNERIEPIDLDLRRSDAVVVSVLR